MTDPDNQVWNLWRKVLYFYNWDMVGFFCWKVWKSVCREKMRDTLCGFQRSLTFKTLAGIHMLSHCRGCQWLNFSWSWRFQTQLSCHINETDEPGSIPCWSSLHLQLTPMFTKTCTLKDPYPNLISIKTIQKSSNRKVGRKNSQGEDWSTWITVLRNLWSWNPYLGVGILTWELKSLLGKTPAIQLVLSRDRLLDAAQAQADVSRFVLQNVNCERTNMSDVI